MGGGGGGMSGTTLSTFTTDDFSGSGVCAFCHSQLTDSTGKDVSIDAHWRSTMMANAAKDPLWQAKISSEAARTPGLQAAIEEKCSRCHMGMARYQDLTNGTSEGNIKVLGTGYLASAHPLHTAAMDGVSCTLCHQVQPEGLGTQAVFTGQYSIDTSTSSPYRLAFGPYNQPAQNPMEMHSGFSPVLGSHVAGSALCSPCHTLYTPYVDASGTVRGEFPEQTTYLEWEHISGTAKKSCQGCHMPDAGSVVISNRPMWLSPRSPFGQHHFVGGNSFMVNLIKSNATILGATADPTHFDATIARTDTMLQSNTGGLAFVSASRGSGALNFTLKVQNKAGHKFPSGIPARRAWIHVTVTDSKNRVVFESGKLQADGSIAGNDADIDALTFEPHYDVINSAGQVQIYEPVMDDSDGNVTYTLLRAAAYAKDNRLIPSGFDKTSASSDIAVVGVAAGDVNFIAGEDQITYQVPNPPSGKLTVKAELLYQAVSYRFARDLSQDSTDLVMRFKNMYDAAGKVPKLVATVQASL